MRTTTTLLLLALGACTITDDKTPSDTDTDTDTDTVESDAPVESDEPNDTDVTVDTDPGFTVAFEQARYRITKMTILEQGGVDLDGDGDVDNAIASVFADLITAFPDFENSLAAINTRMDEVLATDDGIVLSSAERVGGYGVSVSLVPGTTSDAGLVGSADAYDDAGEPKELLGGTFFTATQASLNTGTMSLPLQFYPGQPTVTIQAARVIGQVQPTDTTLNATVGVALPLQAVIDDIVTPIITYELDEDLRDAAITLVTGLLTDRADLDGGTAISGAVHLEGTATAWADPTL